MFPMEDVEGFSQGHGAENQISAGVGNCYLIDDAQFHKGFQRTQVHRRNGPMSFAFCLHKPKDGIPLGKYPADVFLDAFDHTAGHRIGFSPRIGKILPDQLFRHQKRSPA